MPLRAVLFDWDGTLVDSAEASYRCYERLFGSYGIPFDRGLFARSYSPDWYRTYAAVGLAPGDWPEADQRWLKLYAEERCQLLPGVPEALMRLRAAGVKTGLVTSGSRNRVVAEACFLGVADHLDTLVCCEDVKGKKPDPEPLLVALERLAVTAQEAAYVGDSPEDILMARAAAVFSVGIAGSFPNREALRRTEPDLWASGVEEATGMLIVRRAPSLAAPSGEEETL